jgi:hypothetical protein
MVWLKLLAYALGPAAVAYVLVHVPDVCRRAWEVADRHRPVVPRPHHPPIERLAADLHRIGRDLDVIAASLERPGRALKLRSVTLAYDDTLLLACQALDVPPAADRSPLSAAERLQTEAMLANAGLVW